MDETSSVLSRQSKRSFGTPSTAGGQASSKARPLPPWVLKLFQERPLSHPAMFGLTNVHIQILQSIASLNPASPRSVLFAAACLTKSGNSEPSTRPVFLTVDGMVIGSSEEEQLVDPPAHPEAFLPWAAVAAISIAIHSPDVAAVRVGALYDGAIESYVLVPIEGVHAAVAMGAIMHEAVALVRHPLSSAATAAADDAPQLLFLQCYKPIEPEAAESEPADVLPSPLSPKSRSAKVLPRGYAVVAAADTPAAVPKGTTGSARARAPSEIDLALALASDMSPWVVDMQRICGSAVLTFSHCQGGPHDESLLVAVTTGEVVLLSAAAATPCPVLQGEASPVGLPCFSLDGADAGTYLRLQGALALPISTKWIASLRPAARDEWSESHGEDGAVLELALPASSDTLVQEKTTSPRCGVAVAIPISSAPSIVSAISETMELSKLPSKIHVDPEVKNHPSFRAVEAATVDLPCLRRANPENRAAVLKGIHEVAGLTGRLEQLHMEHCRTAAASENENSALAEAIAKAERESQARAAARKRWSLADASYAAALAELEAAKKEDEEAALAEVGLIREHEAFMEVYATFESQWDDPPKSRADLSPISTVESERALRPTSSMSQLPTAVAEPAPVRVSRSRTVAAGTRTLESFSKIEASALVQSSSEPAQAENTAAVSDDAIESHSESNRSGSSYTGSSYTGSSTTGTESEVSGGSDDDASGSGEVEEEEEGEEGEEIEEEEEDDDDDPVLRQLSATERTLELDCRAQVAAIEEKIASLRLEHEADLVVVESAIAKAAAGSEKKVAALQKNLSELQKEWHQTQSTKKAGSLSPKRGPFDSVPIPPVPRPPRRPLDPQATQLEVDAVKKELENQKAVLQSLQEEMSELSDREVKAKRFVQKHAKPPSLSTLLEHCRVTLPEHNKFYVDHLGDYEAYVTQGEVLTQKILMLTRHMSDLRTTTLDSLRAQEEGDIAALSAVMMHRANSSVRARRTTEKMVPIVAKLKAQLARQAQVHARPSAASRTVGTATAVHPAGLTSISAFLNSKRAPPSRAY